MNEKRFIVQIGSGADQHGHNNDCTKAAVKAVKNAISNNCLCGLKEIANLKTLNDLLKMKVHIKIGAPFPQNINKNKILKAVPFGIKSIEIVEGGLITEGMMIKELGDTSNNILICCASVTVSVEL